MFFLKVCTLYLHIVYTYMYVCPNQEMVLWHMYEPTSPQMKTRHFFHSNIVVKSKLIKRAIIIIYD